MREFLEYTLFFVILILLQVFVFDNITLSMYVTPLAYVAFLVMLPFNINSGLLLLLGLITGVVMDFFMGTGGLNTIASLFTAFARPGIINLVFGRDFVREGGGIFTRKDIISGKWFRYSCIVVFLHCLIFIFFETLSFAYIVHTLIKILFSSIITTLIVWFAGSVYPIRR